MMLLHFARWTARPVLLRRPPSRLHASPPRLSVRSRLTHHHAHAQAAPPPSSSSAPVAALAEPRKRRRLPIVLALGLSVLTLGIGGVTALAAYGSYRINRSRPRWFTDTFVLTPESLRIAYKRVTFVTEDGVTLEGWYLEQTVRGRPSERVVLCCNPYMKDKSTLLAVARALWDTGHSVLLFDFRAFAPEQARHETIGHLELRDGRAALAWLRANKPPKAKIGVMGCSMGGAVALSLACEDDTDVVGVATDCAFASLKDVITHYFELKVTPHAPAVAVNAFVDALCAWNKMWYGYDPADVGPLHKLDRLRVPMLLIHSNNDSVVPLEQAHIIHERAATPPELKKLYVVPNVEHIGYFFSDEIAYTRKIVTFLDACFGL